MGPPGLFLLPLKEQGNLQGKFAIGPIPARFDAKFFAGFKRLRPFSLFRRNRENKSNEQGSVAQEQGNFPAGTTERGKAGEIVCGLPGANTGALIALDMEYGDMAIHRGCWPATIAPMPPTSDFTTMETIAGAILIHFGPCSMVNEPCMAAAVRL